MAGTITGNGVCRQRRRQGGKFVSSLDLALIGNGTIGALVDPAGEIVWACFPRFDGDPAFCSLMRERTREQDFGYFSVEMIDLAGVEQEYLANTAILITRLFDRSGGCVEVTDFAPRSWQYGRMFCPMTLVRQVKRMAGSPRIRVHLRPASDYGRHPAATTFGSNHIRYIGTDLVLRMTTNAPITAVLEANPFFLEDAVTLILGPDETVQGAVADVGRRFLEDTTAYWREWVRYLSIPFEWQDAVIRAAITLKLNAFEDTGAIIAAVTTSIPEAPGSGRNWDYRYCWLRDGYFVVNALNRLGQTRTMERYLGYIVNVAAGAEGGRLQPVYGISGGSIIEEREIESLSGYRGMGPVRVGNQAYRQEQHDVYGSAILAATHVFFDRRLIRKGDEVLFRRLEVLGERAVQVFDQPDAGIWELRGAKRVHTFSSVMCWAACDRLARVAAHLALGERATYWRSQADRIHRVVCERAWNPQRGSFAATIDGNSLDASLLLLNEVGFVKADDPRFAGTVHAIERELRHGDFVFRYVEKDDFGEPENAFLVCTFWYINALSALGRRDEARAMFENVLACRNRHGLLAEHIDPRSREQWGNFVQTYSMVGLLNSAIRLSVRWDQAF
ncbi:MAG: glycoside hydrolase family 15 protein [Betaproteobacteria bacterium]|nr:glycoside hydrolase family 15 protein [Betaproteobacteria bacterium]